MSLENTLKEIKSLKSFAEEDVETGDASTLNGRRGRKAQAIEQLKRLKRSYKQELMESAMFLIVVGSERKQFEDIATGPKFGLFSADPEEFYNDLSGRVPQALYRGKESVSNIFDVLGRHLEDKANELDIIGYPQLIFKESYVSTLGNAVDFTKLVKRAVNDQMGAEVVGIQTISSILEKAIDKGHSGKTTPVVLNTGDLLLAMELARDLTRLTSKVFLVQAGTLDVVLKQENVVQLEEVNQNTVKAALATINKTIKK